MASSVLIISNMKRSKLPALKTETVRVLTSTTLTKVVGGIIVKTGDVCPQNGGGTGGCQSTDTPDYGNFLGDRINVYQR